MRSYGGFVWPEKGEVEAPDWLDDYSCGHGLHGLLWGEGDGRLLCWDPGVKWLVVEVEATDVRHGKGDMIGKCKFTRGNVVYCGKREDAVAMILAVRPDVACVGSTITGGDYSTLTGGYRSTLTGGDYSTLTGGYRSALTGGDYSTLIGGDYSTLTGGYGSTLTGGDGATLMGGYRSTLTGGYRSALTGGYGSTLTGGDGATLTGDDYSRLKVGTNGVLMLRRWDGKRYRITVGYAGEDGIEPNVWYVLDPNDPTKFVRDVNQEDANAR